MKITKYKGFGIVWSTTLTEKKAALDVQMVGQARLFHDSMLWSGSSS